MAVRADFIVGVVILTGAIAIVVLIMGAVELNNRLERELEHPKAIELNLEKQDDHQ